MTEKEFSQYKGLNFKYMKLYFLDIINKLHTQNNHLSNRCMFFLILCSTDTAALSSVTSFNWTWLTGDYSVQQAVFKAKTFLVDMQRILLITK